MNRGASWEPSGGRWAGTGVHGARDCAATIPATSWFDVAAPAPGIASARPPAATRTGPGGGGAKAEQRLRHGQLSEGVTGPAWLRGQLCGAGCVFISMASTLRKVGPCRGGEGGRAAAGAPAQRLPHSGPASLLQRDVTAVEDTQIRRVGPADPVEQSAPQGRGGLCPQLGLPCRVERPRGGGKGGAGFPGGAGAPQAKE